MPVSERLRADAAHVLVDQVLELGPPALEAGGGHVRDVVGDDLDVGLLGHHARAGGPERAHRSVLRGRRLAPAGGAMPARAGAKRVGVTWLSGGAGCARRRSGSRSPSFSANCAANWNSRISAVRRVISIIGRTLLPSTAPCTSAGRSIASGALGARRQQPVALGAAAAGYRRSAPRGCGRARRSRSTARAVARDRRAGVSPGATAHAAAPPRAEQGVALHVHDGALGAEGEAAGARVALAARRLRRRRSPRREIATSSGLPVVCTAPRLLVAPGRAVQEIGDVAARLGCATRVWWSRNSREHRALRRGSPACRRWPRCSPAPPWRGSAATRRERAT